MSAARIREYDSIGHYKRGRQFHNWLERLRLLIAAEVGATMTDLPATATAPPATPKVKLPKAPSDMAIAAWRASKVLGLKQSDIRSKIKIAFGATPEQGTISKWISQVEEYPNSRRRNSVAPRQTPDNNRPRHCRHGRTPAPYHTPTTPAIESRRISDHPRLIFTFSTHGQKWPFFIPTHRNLFLSFCPLTRVIPVFSARRRNIPQG